MFTLESFQKINGGVWTEDLFNSVDMLSYAQAVFTNSFVKIGITGFCKAFGKTCILFPSSVSKISLQPVVFLKNQ